jgi:hypothetical protein
MNWKVVPITFVSLTVLWIAGLTWSTVKTRRAAEEFYRWAHDDPTRTHDWFAPGTVAETAPEFTRRFNESGMPFKKHVRIAPSGPSESERPIVYWVTGFGGASDGSGFETGISLTGSHLFSMMRTEAEPGEETNGYVWILIETSLFGL